jgi:hypothetical protein
MSQGCPDCRLRVVLVRLRITEFPLLYTRYEPAGRKKLQHASPAQSLPKDNGAYCVRPVHYKHLFSQIDINRANLVHGRFPSGGLNAPPWHIDAVAGASTPSLPTVHEAYEDRPTTITGRPSLGRFRSVNSQRPRHQEFRISLCASASDIVQ